MADYYGYLASISAVLGGFALAFLGVLLTAPEGRAVSWTTRCAAFATGLFTVTALGWALGASALAAEAATSAERAREFVVGYGATHRWLSMAFIVGIHGFLASLGTAGWIRSRRLGLFTSVVAIGSMLAVLRVLMHFVN
jgi:hypothetical protein